MVEITKRAVCVVVEKTFAFILNGIDSLLERVLSLRKNFHIPEQIILILLQSRDEENNIF